jgi:hypothetical protein
MCLCVYLYMHACTYMYMKWCFRALDDMRMCSVWFRLEILRKCVHPWSTCCFFFRSSPLKCTKIARRFRRCRNAAFSWFSRGVDVSLKAEIPHESIPWMKVLVWELWFYFVFGNCGAIRKIRKLCGFWCYRGTRILSNDVIDCCVFPQSLFRAFSAGRKAPFAPECSVFFDFHVL